MINPLFEYISTDFNINENDYPVPRITKMYINMPIVFVRNSNKYKNGTIGHIKEIYEKYVMVQLEDGKMIKIRPEKIINNYGNAYIIQYPFLQANAITVHKAQGITANKGVIHGDFFEEGHLYSALSRFSNSDGLKLLKPIEPKEVKVSAEALYFSIYGKEYEDDLIDEMER